MIGLVLWLLCEAGEVILGLVELIADFARKHPAAATIAAGWITAAIVGIVLWRHGSFETRLEHDFLRGWVGTLLFLAFVTGVGWAESERAGRNQPVR